jgi:LacI family transcriptional regulator
MPGHFAEIYFRFATTVRIAPMTRPLRIGLVFSHSLAYCRSVLRGVKRFAEACPHWNFLAVGADAHAVPQLQALHPAGVIAHVYSHELARALTELGVPVVNVSGILPDLPLPRVGVDDVQCGKLAAAHLLDRGFRHFAFAGHRDHAYSVRREAGYHEVLEQAGFSPACYYERRRRPFEPMGRLWAQDQELQYWVRSLPRPIGIFAPNDIWGVQLAEVCLLGDIHVPEEVAILGVDNDDLLCELARPSLTSIALPGERIGYEAATLLSRLIRRSSARLKPLLLPPVSVVARRSTDVLAVADANVSAALRFIRAHSDRPIRIADILKAVPVSRRLLERRFRKLFGRSLLGEIRRTHLERAGRLLAETDLPMHIVAEQAGFTNGSQFATVFREMTGRTPSAYRRQFRGRSSGGLAV